MKIFFVIIGFLSTIVLFGALVFAYYCCIAGGATIDYRSPASIALFIYALPGLAYMISIYVAWSVVFGNTSGTILIIGSICASIATFTSLAYLSYASEALYRRPDPEFVAALVAIGLSSLVIMLISSATNLYTITRKLLMRVNSI